MRRSVFIALVVGALGGLGVQLALAQPVDPAGNKVRNLTVTNSLAVGNDLTVGDDLTVTDTVKAEVIDAGLIFSQGPMRSSAASGSCAFAAVTEGARTCFGPDTYARENGNNIELTPNTGGYVDVTVGRVVARNAAAGFSFGTAGSEFFGMAAGSAIVSLSSSGALGTGSQIVLSSTAPTVVACSGTAASVTWSAGSMSFQFDVGTSCAGENTATITLPTATNGWVCHCINTGAATNVRQSGGSTTTAVITNYGTSVATPADWTDGADIRCMCHGG